jgi:hypothetical protein
LTFPIFLLLPFYLTLNFVTFIIFYLRSCVEINVRLENEWTAIDVDATYTVSTGTFLSQGKDGYITFGTIPADKKVDLGVIDAPTFVLYAQQVGALVDPPKDEFSTAKFTAAGNSDFGTCASATAEALTAATTKARSEAPTAAQTAKKPNPAGAKAEKKMFN